MVKRGVLRWGSRHRSGRNAEKKTGNGGGGGICMRCAARQASRMRSRSPRWKKKGRCFDAAKALLVLGTSSKKPKSI